MSSASTPSGKGGHLVAEAAGRKLLNIRPKPGADVSLEVQFVSKGKLNAQLEQIGPDGFTRWGLSANADIVARHFDGLDELIADLTAESSD